MGRGEADAARACLCARRALAAVLAESMKVSYWSHCSCVQSRHLEHGSSLPHGLHRLHWECKSPVMTAMNLWHDEHLSVPGVLARDASMVV